MQIWKYLSGLFILIGILSTPLPTHAQNVKDGAVAEAQILSVHNEQSDNQSNIKNVQLKILDGQLKDKVVTVRDNVLETPYQFHYKAGDKMIITISKDPSGQYQYYITDYARNNTLLVLLLLFLVCTIAVARWQGVTSILGMIVSFGIIGLVIIPNIMQGNDPLFSTIIGAVFIIPITYYLAHGLNKKTTVAIIGTVLTLIVTAILAYAFVEAAKLTGYAAEEAVYLQNAKGGALNVKSVLLAGFIIGALAVLNDITISQASIVRSLLKSNHDLSFKELYANAMSVGKDHVASLVNTLILVYAGASLPLFLLFYNNNLPFTSVTNQEIIATEIVRTLVSSIGIILAVPITTALAAAIELRSKDKKRITNGTK